MEEKKLIHEGEAMQITMPGGKFYFTGANSYLASVLQERGIVCKVVHFKGHCIDYNICERAHDGAFIEIDGIPISAFIDKVANKEEANEYRDKVIRSLSDESKTPK